MEKKRVYYFKNLLTFLNNKDSLPKASFSLIEETKLFYVNGQFFSENTLFNLNQLLENISGELSEKDTTNEAVIKLYKLILKINLDTNNLIKLLVSEIYNLRETTNERIDKTDEIVASGLSLHNNDIDKLKTTTKELKSSTDSLTTTVDTLGNIITSLSLELERAVAAENELRNSKVDKITGKGLSTNDYTTADKTKLDGIATGATKVVVDSVLSNTSTNPVLNKLIKAALDELNVKLSWKLID